MMAEGRHVYRRGESTAADPEVTMIVPVDRRGMVLVSADLVDQMLRDLGFTRDETAEPLVDAMHSWGGVAGGLPTPPGYPWQGTPG